MKTIISVYLFELRAAGRSTLTIMSYQQALKNLFRFLQAQGVEKPGAVSPEHCRSYLAALQDAKLKATTVRKEATIISCFFNWLVQQGILSSNPMMCVRRPRKPWREVDVFSTGELLRMFEAAKHTHEPRRNQAIVALLLDCGLRISEALAIKADDYDPYTASLTIKGKGQKVRMVRLGKRCQQLFECHLAATNGHLWDITREDLGDLIRRMGRRAGVRAYAHKFRRTFAGRFLDAGGTIDELQWLMGHEQISTTMIYAAAGQQERALRSHRQHSPADRLFARQ